jgi:hypothetical protein
MGNKNGFHFFVPVFYKERCLFNFVVFSEIKKVILPKSLPDLGHLSGKAKRQKVGHCIDLFIKQYSI